MPILIPLLLIAVIVISFANGYLRFQKRSDSSPSANQGEPFFDMGAGEEPEEEELTDLVDYYSDHEPAETLQPEKHRFMETEEQYDRLCNLRSGRGYMAECQQLLLRMAESGQQFALCYFDFNRFRFTNTLRGFSTGDYAITRLAQDAKLLFPDGAMFTRISADHFAVLLVYIDENQIQELFDQLKRVAERIRGDVGAKSGLQICMGVALASSQSDYDIFKLLFRARIAHHCHKMTKAEAYSVFDDTMLSSYLYGESALEDYNEHQYADDFLIYMRPQIQIASKRVSACDSMARWVYEDANDSIPVDDGNILPGSNLKVIFQVMRAMNRWRKSGNVLIPTVVPLSSIDFFKDDIDAFFSRCLGEFQIEANLITVSVSLHCARIASEITKTQFRKLRDVGIKTAICDIDRGVQNLDFLEGAPISFLKLHKSFVHDVERFPERQADIQRIISIARRLGAGTIFEGVENSACFGVVVDAGASFAQGRYAGKPTKADSFAEEIATFLKSGPVDVSATVVLDDVDLNKGNFKIF